MTKRSFHDPLAEQHPRNDDGTWQQHCTVCGTYIQDSEHEPAIDFMCDDCIERDDE
jgi:hypothetical protein